VLLGFAVNLAHPRRVRFGSFSAPTACGLGSSGAVGGTPAPSVELLSLAQVASLCADPRALVADARSAQRFAEGHITGAIHLPCASSRVAASAALDQLAGKETLVVYGDATADAIPVAEELRRLSGRSGAAELRVAVLA